MKNNLLMIGLETLREDLGIMEEYSVKEERLEEIAAAMEQLKITWSNALPEMEEVKKQLQ